ncbi:MAG TPA: bi-domain-containing oxidoreductase [Verrucomicrobiae bacterium]|nr:bi-domain-containing oxidoreductase [Verrucomicrobiae bacterium]
MKQIAQYQDGRLELQEVPLPVVPPGGILVRATHSVISVGTEKMKVEQAKMNLLQKARARPDQVRKVLDSARTLGWKAALEKVRNRLESPSPLGYSAAGIVAAVDPANTRFRVGDNVAVGGAECAFHAEWIAVPDMLAAPVPTGVPNWQAAYTTIASIALQTVRQLEPTLGERVLVMGQGLVGLLVTSLLRANGVRVMAVDIAAGRKSYAEAMGAEQVVILGPQNLANEVRAWTEGYGVDAVVLCTATASNAPIEQSADALRDRGRIVIVGNTKADLAWKTFYEKELDVRYSRSYGPGRYDPSYEWGGADYPLNYVRWTEQRNFEACLHLMKTGQLDLAAITTRRVPFTSALEVYKDLLAEGNRDVGVVLEYPVPRAPVGGEKPPVLGEAASPVISPAPAQAEAPATPPPPKVPPQKLAQRAVRLDVIGAGNFARTMLLPHLKDKLHFGTIVNQTALSANHVRTKFGFAEALTDYSLLFQRAGAPAVPDSGIALVVATRHHLHAPIVKRALELNRHIFVEKPLCLTREELVEIDTVQAKSQGSVQVGFNRRFAGASIELRKLLANTPGPKSASYRVMAGKLDPVHWYANYAESGGRVLGEACHFLDYFCFLFDSKPTRVSAQTVWPATGRLPFPDSVTAQVEFADGSSGQLIYTAEGDTSWPKELCTVYGAGFVAEIENFQSLVIHKGRRAKKHKYGGKGHAEQMAAWLAFLQGEAAHPFPYEQTRASMRLTFAVLESIQTGKAVELA